MQTAPSSFSKIIIRLLRKEIVLVTIGIQAIGFTFFVLYYNFFNIPILYYLTLTDILLYTIMVMILYGSYLLILRYLIIDSVAKLLYKFNAELHANSWAWLPIGLLHIGLTLGYASLISTLIYQLPIYTITFGIFMSGTLVMDTRDKNEIPKNAEIVREEKTEDANPQEYMEGRLAFIKLSLFVLGLTFILITSDANRVKKGETTLSFSTNDNSYYVGYKSKVKLVGETSLYLFTYDTLTNISTAHNKSEVENIKFYPY